MSPAYSSNPDDKFCWVGIIMYMPPTQTASQREEIRKAFVNYGSSLAPLIEKYNAQIHWAKLELPISSDPNYSVEMKGLRDRIARGYPVNEFNAIRRALDPAGILSNRVIDKLF
jgi:hypothetical protein